MPDPVTTIVGGTVVKTIGGIKKASSQRKQASAEAAAIEAEARRRAELDLADAEVSAALDLEETAIAATLDIEENEIRALTERELGEEKARIGVLELGDARFEAETMRSKAQQVKAAQQRAAAEERRLARLKESQLIARAAASGGGASDPTVMMLLGELEGEGEYNALVAMYEGDVRSQDLEMGAVETILQGERKRDAGQIALDAAHRKSNRILTASTKRNVASVEAARRRYDARLKSAKAREEAGIENATSAAALTRSAGKIAATSTLFSTATSAISGGLSAYRASQS